MSDAGYQVIARKWRPQRFDEVVGQAPIVRTLSNALEQKRFAHAYCFSGIRGVGKTTIARLLAKGLNCRASEGPTSTPCGRCESCVEIEGSRSLDVLERDAASERGIDEMRQLIEVSRYAPSRDRFKVFILDEAHMLTKDASNALLKVLEEPPGWIVFMLATTEPEKILPTILSRCQHYQLRRISQQEITGHLGKIAAAEGVDISDDALALLATAADGSLRDGQSLLDKLIAFAGEKIDENTVIELLGLIDRVLLYRSTDLIAAGDVPGTLHLVDEMVDSGIDLHQFTVDLLGHFRNLLIVRTVPEAGAILHLPEADIDRLRKQAEGFTVDDLDRAFSLLAGNEYRIKTAEQPRYHVEIVLARLARMPSIEPLADLLAELRGGEGGEGSGGADSGGGGSRPAAGARKLQSRSARSVDASSPPAAGQTRERRERSSRPESGSSSPAPPAAETPASTHPPDVSAATAAHAERESPAPNPPAASKPGPPPFEQPAAEDTPPLDDEPPHPADDPRFGGPSRPTGPSPSQADPEPPGSEGTKAEPAAMQPMAAAAGNEPRSGAEPAPEPTTDATAATTPALEDEPRDDSTAASVSLDLPMPELLRRIQEQVSQTHPLIAQVLDRCGAIQLSGERLELQFASSHGIFVQRLRDPEIIQLLGESARHVTGRSMIARVEMSDAVSARLRPVPADEPDATTRPANASDGPGPSAGGSGPSGPNGSTSNGGPAETPAQSDSPTAVHGGPPNGADPAALRARAEQEPRVQEFLKALRGQIVSVEELNER